MTSLSAFRIDGWIADRIEQSVVTVLWAWLVYRGWPPAFTAEYASSIMLLISEGAVLLFLLLRRPTERISLKPWDWLIAAGGSVIPLLVSTTAPLFLPSVGTPVMLAGFVMHVGAKLSLNASFGLVAANRGVKRRGMYRLVRHPMYAGYILSHIGFLIARPAWLNAGLYGLELVLQVLRIQAEERVLRADPSYRSFAEQVRYRLLPGVY